MIFENLLHFNIEAILTWEEGINVAYKVPEKYKIVQQSEEFLKGVAQKVT